MNAMAKADNTAKKIDLDIGEAAKAPPALVPAIANEKPTKKPRSKRLLLMIAFPLVLIVGGSYVWVTGGRYQETENATLQQAKVTIAPDAAGRIVESNVIDNAHVKMGDLLFVVDPAPAKIALAQAEAALAMARVSVEQLRAAHGQAQAQEAVASQEVDYLSTELDRQKELSRKGITTRSALDTAERDLAKARQQLVSAKQGVVAALAALGGSAEIKTDDHPAVLEALAARDKAALSLSQTTVRAPADGVVSQAASFKTGQYVSAGTPLFSLVETGDEWIEANFKETQLTHMKLGQKAEVELDTYPGHPFEATVESIGAGTGAEFSLLPAQNATGNWVKVTQRIPVTLRVEANGNDGMAMRTGMSASVSVDTGVARGLGIFAGLGSYFGVANAGE